MKVKMLVFLVFSAILCTMSDIIGNFDEAKVAYAETWSSIVIERESGRVLYENNADKIRPMASTTKIATAIAVIENVPDLLSCVLVPECAQGIEGSSVYLKAGESLTYMDLLHGLMLQSGNDCAVALAVLVGKSVEGFSLLMNEIAVKAGATSSNFINPHGLHDKNHYTTARDLAKISAYAMKNAIFRQIVATKRYVMTNGKVVLNKNKILSGFEGGDGIKTGYTKNAGRCLVSSATRDDMGVICVVLNCQPMFEESKRLMNRAFSDYEMTELVSPKNFFALVEKGRENFVELAAQSLRYPIKKDGSDNLSYAVSGIKKLVAPFDKGEENGNFNVYLNKHLIFSQKLYTIYGVEQKSLTDFIDEIIAG